MTAYSAARIFLGFSNYAIDTFTPFKIATI